jgi:hypothetical protein
VKVVGDKMRNEIISQTALDPNLALHTMKAIRNPEKWQSVLSHIMAETGAKAAMITLRDATTCQIVDDLALQRTYHSPLIRGFSAESAGFYLQELREVDPWAEAQRLHYPHHPILMSRICSPKNFPENRFFNWLRELRMSETVVFELERLPGYWTACNLFVETAGSETALKVLKYAERHQTLLREAWQTSQTVRQGAQSREVSLDHVEAPACIVNHLFEVVGENRAFEGFQDDGQALCHGPRKKLSIADSIVLMFRGDEGKDKVARHRSGQTGIRAVATPFAPDPLHENTKLNYHLIVFYGGQNSKTTSQLSEKDLDGLTFQERKMLKAVRSGAGVREAGEIIGVKRSRSFEIWASIKIKMAIPNAHIVRNG